MFAPLPWSLNINARTVFTFAWFIFSLEQTIPSIHTFLKGRVVVGSVIGQLFWKILLEEEDHYFYNPTYLRALCLTRHGHECSSTPSHVRTQGSSWSCRKLMPGWVWPLWPGTLWMKDQMYLVAVKCQLWDILLSIHEGVTRTTPYKRYT